MRVQITTVLMMASITVGLGFSLPVYAEEATQIVGQKLEVENIDVPIALTPHLEIEPYGIAPGYSEVKIRLKFKDRHPKLYRTYRKGRHACIMFLPFLSVTAQVAQIITPFVL